MKENFKLFLFRMISVIYRLFYIFPLKNRITICSFQGKGYVDNPKYITDEIHKMDDRIEIWCVVKNSNIQVPDYVHPVKKSSLKELFIYATSKVIINNSRFPLYLPKRKGQYFVETWHGSFPLKKIGFAMENISKTGKLLVENDSKVTDLFISGSTVMKDIYRRDFQYKGDILECGLPRHDEFFRNTQQDELRQKLGINKNDFVVLYAPTFRDNNDRSVYDIYFPGVKKVVEDKYKKPCKILIRFHPNMADYAKNIQKAEWLIDVTRENDIYPFMMVSDMLITDYSGVAQEFSWFMRRPVFLYAKDKEKFQNTRGTYYKIDDMPYPIAENNADLIKLIRTYDRNKDTKIKEFFSKAQFFCKGNSSRDAAEYILKKSGLLEVKK